MGFDSLERLRQCLAEQKGRHQGGLRWIGMAGKSTFGAYGDHAEAVRTGQDEGCRGGAVKVWDQRVQGSRAATPNGSAQYQDRAAPSASVCARRGGRGARS